MDLKVLTGCNDDSEERDSIFVVELMKLEKDIVENVIIKEMGDFTVYFSSGKRLDVFCDITSSRECSEERENWTLCNVKDNNCYNFTDKFDFKKEPYN
ncbi:MAG: hypothetical protein H0X63_09315 [Flavobacteriales bacterium]|nr:hypothetical protein [Flavobacteriales bacterium]